MTPFFILPELNFCWFLGKSAQLKPVRTKYVIRQYGQVGEKISTPLVQSRIAYKYFLANSPVPLTLPNLDVAREAPVNDGWFVGIFRNQIRHQRR